MAARPSSTSRSNKNFRSVSAKTGPASGPLAVRVSAPGRHRALTVVGGGSRPWVWFRHRLAECTTCRRSLTPGQGRRCASPRRPAQRSAPPKMGQPASPSREEPGCGVGAHLALTFPTGSWPAVWWEEEEHSQEKRHRKETQKEGWRLAFGWGGLRKSVCGRKQFM